MCGRPWSAASGELTRAAFRDHHDIHQHRIQVGPREFDNWISEGSALDAVADATAAVARSRGRLSIHGAPAAADMRVLAAQNLGLCDRPAVRAMEHVSTAPDAKQAKGELLASARARAAQRSLHSRES